MSLSAEWWSMSKTCGLLGSSSFSRQRVACHKLCVCDRNSLLFSTLNYPEVPPFPSPQSRNQTFYCFSSSSKLVCILFLHKVSIQCRVPASDLRPSQTAWPDSDHEQSIELSALTTLQSDDERRAGPKINEFRSS